MMPDPTLYRLVAQAQQEDKWREAEQLRLLARSPQHRWSIRRHAAAQLGTWLKQFKQLHPALKEHL